MTLIEILVALSILVVVMLAITAAMGTMQNIWVKIRGKADAYRATRTAAQAILQRLGQATLNSRWVANTDSTTKDNEPYVRASDLHFVSGPASTVLALGGAYPGHALFFQGPFGEPVSTRVATNNQSYDQLSHTLCAWGYFVEFSSDDQDRPDFLNSVQDRFPPRRRFRLWEFRQPAQELTLFEMDQQDPPQPVLSAPGVSKERLYQWFRQPLQFRSAQERHLSVVAENILALIATPFDPALAESKNEYRLAPDGYYDSRRFQWEPNTDLGRLTRHRFPPALRLTLVALSEDSWQRMTSGEIETTANQLRSLINSRFSRSDRFEQDMESLTSELNRIKMGYRIITLNLKMPEQ